MNENPKKEENMKRDDDHHFASVTTTNDHHYCFTTVVSPAIPPSLSHYRFCPTTISPTGRVRVHGHVFVVLVIDIL
jgi:hypothetical protein